jgi:cellulose synthase/poly-beta-1,6-N-acetylglucosamine synthase-like glycosyltransferase
MLGIIQAVGLGVGLIFIGLLTWGLRREYRRGMVGTADPALRVSVLVAARNEERDLPRLLASLAAQDYPADQCEFILINDGATDRTPELIQAWADRDERFRLINLEDAPIGSVGPKKRALQAGLNFSRGEIILVTDADCCASLAWISCMAGYFTDGVGAVCGAVRYTPEKTFYSRLAAGEGLMKAVLNAGVIGLGGALSCAGANFAYKKEAFTQVGGFDQGGTSLSGDDDLLLQRFRHAGLKIRYNFSPEARVETEPPAHKSEYWLRKRRHLSAGRHYALHWIILATVLYLGCVATVVMGIMTLAGGHAGYGFAIWWGLFSLSLALVFHYGLNLLGERRWLSWSLPAAIIFPIWFVLVQPFTLLRSPAWKGRSGVSFRSNTA